MKTSTQRHGLPSFWVTHVAKALAGDQPCLLAPWLSGHYHFVKRISDDQASLAIWKMNHTAQLMAHVEAMRLSGWSCAVERFFKVEGHTAVLSGKADIIAQRADHRPLIVDIKSGQPRESDILQVLIEMVTVPLAWNSPSMLFNGKVIYTTHTVDLTPTQADELKPQLIALLKRLGGPTRPEATSSESTCRLCDVPDDLCGSRWSGTASTAKTEVF